MMIWLTLLPFSLWGSCGWATIPLCGLIAFLLLGALGRLAIGNGRLAVPGCLLLADRALLLLAKWVYSRHMHPGERPSDDRAA
jgi:hypothetical protein